MEGDSSPLARLINLIDDLDAVVPEASKDLLDELDRIHDALDGRMRSLEAKVTEATAGGGGQMQYRQLERDLEDAKDSLRARENEVQKLHRESVSLEARLAVNDEDLKQVKADRRELQRQLDRMKEKQEEDHRKQQAALAQEQLSGNESGGLNGSGPSGPGGATVQLQEANYELQQQLNASQGLLAQEDAELRRALGELQALAETNDDLTRRLDQATKLTTSQEDDLVLASAELAAAVRARQDAEAALADATQEAENLRLEYTTVVPGLERDKVDLQLQVRSLQREVLEAREAALGGSASLEATGGGGAAAAVDELRAALAAEQERAVAAGAERDQLRDDREVLEQVIADLSSEALGLSVGATTDRGGGGAGQPNGAVSAQELQALQHELEVARAANAHLGSLAAERAAEVEALQREQDTLLRGDAGAAALVAEQKALRAKLREARRDLESARLRGRDAEEAKLHLEQRAEAVVTLVESRAYSARDAARNAQAASNSARAKPNSNRNRKSNDDNLLLTQGPTGAGNEGVGEGSVDGSVDSRGSSSRSRDDDDGYDNSDSPGGGGGGGNGSRATVAAANAAASVLAGAAAAARAIVAAPLAAAHQTTAMRLRAEVQELEEQAREKDARIGSLYDRLRAQAQALAEAEGQAAAAAAASHSSSRFPALLLPGGNEAATTAAAAGGKPANGRGGSGSNLEREERLEAELESSKAAIRRLQADLAQAQRASSQDPLHQQQQHSASPNSTPVRHFGSADDLADLKRDILRTVQAALAENSNLSSSSHNINENLASTDAEPSNRALLEAGADSALVAASAGAATPSSSRRPSSSQGGGVLSDRGSADLEAQIERRLLERQRNGSGSVAGIPGGGSTPRLGPARSSSYLAAHLAAGDATAIVRTPRTTLLGDAPGNQEEGNGGDKGTGDGSAGQGNKSSSSHNNAASNVPGSLRKRQSTRSTARARTPGTGGSGSDEDSNNNGLGQLSSAKLGVSATAALRRKMNAILKSAVGSSAAPPVATDSTATANAENISEAGAAAAAAGTAEAAAGAQGEGANSGRNLELAAADAAAAAVSASVDPSPRADSLAPEALVEALAEGLNSELAAAEARHSQVHDELAAATEVNESLVAEVNRLRRDVDRLSDQANLKTELKRILGGGIPVQQQQQQQQQTGGVKSPVPALELSAIHGTGRGGGDNYDGNNGGEGDGGSSSRPSRRSAGALIDGEGLSSGRLASTSSHPATAPGTAQATARAQVGAAGGGGGGASDRRGSAGSDGAHPTIAEGQHFNAQAGGAGGANESTVEASFAATRGGGGRGGHVPYGATAMQDTLPSHGSNQAYQQQQQQQQYAPPHLGLMTEVTFGGAGPTTAEGKALLAATLRDTQLPPEDWADEVRDVYSQLAVALELLAARESELQEADKLVQHHEASLAEVRRRTAHLYAEHVAYAKESEAKEAAATSALEAQQLELTKLTLKHDALDALLQSINSNGGGSGGSGSSAAVGTSSSGGGGSSGSGGSASLSSHAASLAKKCARLEANELVLRRRCGSLEEQAAEEVARRLARERASVEADADAKARLLYLEEWKRGAGERLERQAAALSRAVPKHDHVETCLELDSLRSDYLNLMAREAELRLKVHRQRTLPTELAQLQKAAASHATALQREASRAAAAEAEAQAAKKELKALLDSGAAGAAASSGGGGGGGGGGLSSARSGSSGSGSSGNSYGVGHYTSDRAAAAAAATQALLARQSRELVELHGQHARATAQLAAAAEAAALREHDAARTQATLTSLEHEQAAQRKSEEVAWRELSLAKQQRDELVRNYGSGGLTRAEAEALQQRCRALEAERSGLRRERHRLAEQAAQAAEQATQVLALRDAHQDDLASLRARCAELEAHSEESALVGQLQRQLSATRASYKAFVRKYDAALARARRKEAANRTLEERLDGRDAALLSLGAEKQLQVGALKDALSKLTGKLLLGDQTLELAKLHLSSSSSSNKGSGRSSSGNGNGNDVYSNGNVGESGQEGGNNSSSGERGGAPAAFAAALDALLAGSEGAAHVSASLRAAVTSLGREHDATVQRLDASEARCAALEHHARELEAQLQTAQSLHQSLAPLFQQPNGNGNSGNNSTNTSRAVRDAAGKLVQLSDEVRRQKLELLRTRAQVQRLREEKRAAGVALAHRDAQLLELQEAKIEAETEAMLLQGLRARASEYGDEDYENNDDGLNKGNGYVGPLNKKTAPSSSSSSSENGGAVIVRDLMPPDLSLSISKPLREGAAAAQRRVMYNASSSTSSYHGPLHGGVHAPFGIGGDQQGHRISDTSPSASMERQAAALETATKDVAKYQADANAATQAARRLQEDLAERDEELAARQRDAEAVATDLRFYAKQADANGLSHPPPNAAALRASARVATRTGYGDNTDGRGKNEPAERSEGQQQQQLSRRNGGLSPQEVEELKRVSSATIGSLQTVIAEKNRMIEKYRAQLVASRSAAAAGATDDKLAVEQLTNKMFRENEDALQQLKSAAQALERAGTSSSGGGDNGHVHDVASQLYAQLEAAALASSAHEATVAALEVKVRTQLHARERAEQRCGAALAEMERMKADMLLLAAQLQAAEEANYAHTTSNAAAAAAGGAGVASATQGSEGDSNSGAKHHTAVVSAERVNALQGALAAKDKKLAALRQAIVALKHQFEESEVAHETRRLADEKAHQAALANGGSGSGGSGGEGDGGTAAQVHELRGKLESMQHALQAAAVAAEQEVLKARRANERLKTERTNLRSERDATDQRCGALEAQVASLQDACAAAKSEAERQRHRADRLVRQTNKYQQSSGTSATSSSGGGPGAASSANTGSNSPAAFGDATATSLRAENERLVAMNAALRSDLDDRRRSTTGRPGTAPAAAAASSSSSATADADAGSGVDGDVSQSGGGGGESPRGGRRLGGGAAAAPSTSSPAHGSSSSSSASSGPALERMRTAERQAKRLSERLASSAQKLRDAEAEIASLKTRCEQALKGKSDVERRLDKVTKEIASLREGGAAGLGDLETARARVFELEEAQGQLKRRAEVELPMDIKRLQQQLAAAEARASSASNGGNGRSSSGVSGVGGRRGGGTASGAFSGPGRSMRESDDAFLRAEALSDELAEVRKAKEALELQLLGQDASALELKFDLGLAQQEASRLKRRVKELEAALSLVQGSGGTGGNRTSGEGSGDGGGSNRGAGQRFSRVDDLEGVVEGLQRVVHKLKAENERLRAGAGEQVKLAAAQRSAKDAKVALASATDELQRLRAKATAGEDAMGKLAARAEQLSQAKRQLRQRDEELRASSAAAASEASRADAAESELQEAALRIQQLEREQQQSRRAGSTRNGGDGGDNSSSSSVAAQVSAAEEAAHWRKEANRLQSQQAQTSQEGSGIGRGGQSQARNREDQRAYEQQAAELDGARREIRRLQDRLARASSGSGAGGGGSAVAAEELGRLRSENAKLREELAAFDLDFFEEIEDLKYKYAEATQRLRTYEGGM